ncbi:MAG: Gfo/Idh/MocA family oxidoreductase [Legionella sp.]
MNIPPANKRVLIVGGSGLWCNRTHHPAILALKQVGFRLQVAAICDPVDPYKNSQHQNLLDVLALDKPLWLFNADKTALFAQLSALHQEKPFDLMITACDPVDHLPYCQWAAEHKIPVICDKPLLVHANAASDLKAAQAIQTEYSAIAQEFFAANINVFMNLGYRYDPMFIKVAQQLRQVYEMTGEGISYFNLFSNSGIKRFNKEFFTAAGHGYLAGVGSASHTCYHLIDLMAWFLQNAPGKVAQLKLSLPYILRVKDYIRAQKSAPLARYFQNDNELPDGISEAELEAVMEAEYDFNLHIQLLDEEGKLLGLMQLFNCHSGYSDRVSDYEPEQLRPNCQPQGGRMKQMSFDIHQGSIHNIHIVRNNVVHQQYKAHVFRRLSPVLGLGDVFSEHIEREPSLGLTETGEVARPPFRLDTELTMHCIKQSLGAGVELGTLKSLAGFHNQALSQAIFAKLYELIAYDCVKKKIPETPEIDTTIVLEDYLQTSNIAGYII